MTDLINQISKKIEPLNVPQNFVIRREHAFSLDFKSSKAAITMIAMGLVILLWQAGITFSICFAPIRLLTKEIVVVSNELTITKKSIEILLTTLAAASSHSPKCSIATKNRNQGAIQKNDRTIVQTDMFSK